MNIFFLKWTSWFSTACPPASNVGASPVKTGARTHSNTLHMDFLQEEKTTCQQGKSDGDQDARPALSAPNGLWHVSLRPKESHQSEPGVSNTAVNHCQWHVDNQTVWSKHPMSCFRGMFQLLMSSKTCWDRKQSSQDVSPCGRVDYVSCSTVKRQWDVSSKSLNVALKPSSQRHSFTLCVCLEGHATSRRRKMKQVNGYK